MNKSLGRMENDMKKWIKFFGVMFILANLVGCGKRWESKDNTDMERDGQTVNNFTGSQSNIDYGIEVRTDINGDGNIDRVRVYDTVSGDYAFTQVSAILNDDSNFFIDYSDSRASSYLVAGDLSGNGKADVVVIRYSTGSTFNGCDVSVLHMACVDPLNDIVQSVDCSYRDDGWYIEDIQIVNDYWEEAVKVTVLVKKMSRSMQIDS